ncbi:nucleotidyltransferase domain-containing protein [Kitasatospora sp. NPDC101801]|uniref:nucleotidyltransferase domain-containing protein n=1 Tax=Kitasatospora sp. NPDC101801 TaxID=3364103 RepID=UPI00381D3E05
MLHRLDGDGSWPLSLVRQVWLFGSFTRGATEPHDVDVAVRFDRDEQMIAAVVQVLMSGRGNPFAPLRRALAGTSRGLEFQFEDQAREQLQAEGVVMLPLWQRGNTLSQALTVLHGIDEDPGAGRAERDDMIDAFTGLDRYISRPVRAELIGWQQQDLITVSQ